MSWNHSKSSFNYMMDNKHNKWKPTLPLLSRKIDFWSSGKQRWARAKATRLWMAFSPTRIKYSKCFSTWKPERKLAVKKSNQCKIVENILFADQMSHFNKEGDSTKCTHTTTNLFLQSFQCLRHTILRCLCFNSKELRNFNKL